MKTLTGLFQSPTSAAAAIRTLESRGVPAGDISVIAAETTGRESFGIREHSRVAEGAAVGAGLGGAVGAIAAGLTLVGSLATGGVGLIAAGPIVAALAGAGAGATAGGLVGTAIGLAIPEHEIKHYEDAFAKGAVLVGVRCPDDAREDLAKETFKAHGVSKVSHA
ncbi:MAG: hypothetical protein R3B68_16165 [Phycisphaerales bacterium]